MDLSKKYVSEVIYVVSYDRDLQVRLKQADAEQTFRALFPVQSFQMSVPDEIDPNIPRIVFRIARRQLTISQIAVQMTLRFDRQGDAFGANMESVSKSIREFHDCLLRFKSKESLRENALVVTINYPTDLTQDEMHEFLYQRFFKIDPIAKLASLSFKLGFRTSDDYFENLEANVYELRVKDFDPPILATSVIDLSQIPVVEKGYSVKIDVNNKPMVMDEKKYLDVGPEGTIAKVVELAMTGADKFMGFSGPAS